MQARTGAESAALRLALSGARSAARQPSSIPTPPTPTGVQASWWPEKRPPPAPGPKPPGAQPIQPTHTHRRPGLVVAEEAEHHAPHAAQLVQHLEQAAAGRVEWRGGSRGFVSQSRGLGCTQMGGSGPARRPARPASGAGCSQGGDGREARAARSAGRESNESGWRAGGWRRAWPHTPPLPRPPSRSHVRDALLSASAWSATRLQCAARLVTSATAAPPQPALPAAHAPLQPPSAAHTCGSRSSAASASSARCSLRLSSLEEATRRPAHLGVGHLGWDVGLRVEAFVSRHDQQG